MFNKKVKQAIEDCPQIIDNKTFYTVSDRETGTFFESFNTLKEAKDLVEEWDLEDNNPFASHYVILKVSLKSERV